MLDGMEDNDKNARVRRAARLFISMINYYILLDDVVVETGEPEDDVVVETGES